MTEQYVPKNGEHVRIIVEGLVRSWSNDIFRVGDIAFYIDPNKENVEGAKVTYERIVEPLPETVGSTVVFADGRVCVRNFGTWMDMYTGASITSESIQELMAKSPSSFKVTTAER